MRSFLVENLDELIEARLLLKEIRSRWFGSFFFQSEMHAFMPAVLLRMAGLDAFDADAQPKPPHGQLAQVEQRVSGSEGHAVVAADVGRQAALAKKSLKHSERITSPCRRARDWRPSDR